MKTKILLLLLMTASMSYGQLINLYYDAAGNQSQRVICIGANCTARMANPENLKTAETVTAADMLKSDVSAKISYYPNPVKEELYVKWENTVEKSVVKIEIYSMLGQLMKTYNNIENDNITTLAFSSYPSGNYIVNLIYNNQEKKTLQIIKQ